MLIFSVLKTVAIKSYSEVAKYFILVITFKQVEPKEIENWFLFWYMHIIPFKREKVILTLGPLF